jgi:putative transposase
LGELFDGFLGADSHVLMDRDTKYSETFRRILTERQVEIVRLAAKSPNLTAYVERFLRSLKEECLGRLILFGEGSLRNAGHEFLEHCHRECNHHGLANRLIDPEHEISQADEVVQCRERLGGWLNYHTRQAA